MACLCIPTSSLAIASSLGHPGTGGRDPGLAAGPLQEGTSERDICHNWEKLWKNLWKNEASWRKLMGNIWENSMISNWEVFYHFEVENISSDMGPKGNFTVKHLSLPAPTSTTCPSSKKHCVLWDKMHMSMIMAFILQRTA